MNQRALDQLDKVLALADSDHEGEALGALRMARKLLEREGLQFSDLASVLGKISALRGTSFFSAAQVQLEAQIEQLQDDLAAHVEQNASLSGQIESWRRRAFELEQMLALTQTEAARWKETARETAERLWDLGKMAHAEAFLSQEPFPEDGEDERTKKKKTRKIAG